jgi:large conductance mechanosensitive channel
MKSTEILGQSGGFLKRSWAEFRDFAFKGNLVDLAIGFVIGGAFKSVVDAFINEIFVPIINHVTALFFKTGEGTAVLPEKWKHVNNFIAALLNFLIVAFAVFILFVKVLGALMKKTQAPPPAGEPTTKECPMCCSMIPIKARKCPNCTSDLPVTA